MLNLVRPLLGDEDLLPSDVGMHKVWVARNFLTYAPNRVLISNGLASMGFAVPGAVAASLRNPERKVVAAVGDGGFLMTSQELETAQRLGVGFTTLVFLNNDYELIRFDQERDRGESTGTRIGNPDFKLYAESYGLKGYRPLTLKELRANLASEAWRQRSFAERALPMRAAASILRRDRERFAALMADEMGKPVDQGLAEVDKCAWVCEYYADHAADFLADRPIETDAAKSYITHQPIGVILAIMPWNYPFWQVFRFLAPSLMAGNAAVLQHASNVPGCATAIEEVLKEAGLPGDLFRALLIVSNDLDALIEHPLIRAVTLTGSVTAGKAVAAKAGAVLKLTLLELGGSAVRDSA